jgi:hypothetical protein
MLCREVSRLLPEYSAEALARSQMARVREHLDACEACRLELARLKRVLGLVETYAAVRPPDGLWVGVRARIEAGEADRGSPIADRRSRGRFWLPGLTFGGAWRWAGGLALATGLAVTFWVARPLGPDGRTKGPVQISDPELVAAVQQHALASAGQFFADRAGLESIVVLVRKNREIR